ncbi:MAG: hypothetical protein Tsb002_23640 [Wenzhouxiangellaceae bacterium]
MFGFLLVGLVATSRAQYLMPEPVSWDELQIIQQDSLATAEELGLSTNKCPKEAKDIVYTKKSTFYQNILYTDYLWDDYQTSAGRCLVLRSTGPVSVVGGGIGIGAEDPIVLNTNQAQVLLSASAAMGFEEKGFHDEAWQANLVNAQLRLQHGPSQCIDPTNPSDNRFYPEEFTVEITNEEMFNILRNSDARRIIEESGGTSTMVIQPAVAVPTRITCNKVLNEESSFLPAGGDPRINITNTQEFPYYVTAKLFPDVLNPNAPGGGTAIFVSPFAGLTAAHNLFRLSSQAPRVSGDMVPGCYETSPPTVTSVCPFQSIATAAYTYPGNYPQLQGANLVQTWQFDYGAILTALPHNVPAYPMLNLTTTGYGPSDVSVISGYPGSAQNRNWITGLFEDRNFILGVDSTNTLAASNAFSSSGQSGGPAFLNNNNVSNLLIGHIVGQQSNGTSLVTWIHDYGAHNATVINAWRSWRPTVFFEYGANPQSGTTYDLLEIPPFEVNAFTIAVPQLAGGDIPDDEIAWRSSLSGAIANGSVIDTSTLQQQLPVGEHLITTSINSGSLIGERSVLVEITGPSGQFDVSPEYCIVNLNNPQNNTCEIVIDWQVIDSPSSGQVWNATESTVFAAGHSGPATWLANTQGTRFTLHESSERILTLDEITVDAKVPAGTLSSNLAVCALEPKPTAPDGTPRDPQSTPPGCGVQLSWSNLSYAAPHIYYRQVGQAGWSHLHSIPFCAAGPCSGAVHTDDLIPELVPATGMEFKWVQFQHPDSGVLSTPFVVTAQRFADAYEFNNSWQHATEVVLGEAQYGHNFHKPTIYDPSEDVDLFKLDISALPSGQRLVARTFNQMSSLNISMDVLCIGEREFRPNGGDWEGVFGAWPFHIDPNIVQQPGSAPNSREILWDVQKFSTWNVAGGSYRLSCESHLIQAERSMGAPSSNLTYAFVVLEHFEPVLQPDEYENDDTQSLSKFHNCGVHEHNFVDDRVDWAGPFETFQCPHGLLYDLSVRVNSLQSGIELCTQGISLNSQERAADPFDILEVTPCASGPIPDDSRYQIEVICDCVEPTPPPPI